MKRLALISVSNKKDIVPFARELIEKHNYAILSTGGTAKLLDEHGIPTKEVGEYTGFPENDGGTSEDITPQNTWRLIS